MSKRVFLELGHSDKHSPTTREEKFRREKISVLSGKAYKFLFKWEILHIDDHNQGKIRQTFQIRALFSQIFKKGSGDLCPLPPLVTRLNETSICLENWQCLIPQYCCSQHHIVSQQLTILKQFCSLNILWDLVLY